MKYYTPEHHSLDVWPVPRDKQPMYINEPWLIDRRWKYESSSRSTDWVDKLISQIEIYDQIWFVRHIPKDGSKHSQEAKDLVREFCDVLLEISDEGAEMFPFWTIQGLYEEFLPEEELPDMYDR